MSQPNQDIDRTLMPEMLGLFNDPYPIDITLAVAHFMAMVCGLSKTKQEATILHDHLLAYLNEMITSKYDSIVEIVDMAKKMTDPPEGNA